MLERITKKMCKKLGNQIYKIILETKNYFLQKTK